MNLLAGRTGIVCDLDGVVYRGPDAVPHAVDALADAGVPVHYATNNASRPPADVAAHLERLGLRVEPGEVTTSSQAGAWLLADRLDAGAAVLVIGGPGVSAAVAERGLDPVTPQQQRDGVSGPAVAAVLQGYGGEVTALDLAEAAYAVHAGALWCATNTDATLPTERGSAPGNGALIGAVSVAVGAGPDLVAGKPHEPLYLLCAERMGEPADRLLAIGDRLETDIEGARRTGMSSVLVLTGVHGVRDAVLAPPAQRPDVVVPDLRWLRTPIEGRVLEANSRIAALHTSIDANGGDTGALDDRLPAEVAAIDEMLDGAIPG